MDYSPIKPPQEWHQSKLQTVLTYPISRTFGMIIGAVFLALFVFGSVMWFAAFRALAKRSIAVANSQPAETKPDPLATAAAHWDSTNGKIGAFVMSQTFMKRRLKSPSTADFPWYTDSEVSVSHRGGGTFLVESYVDSQNAFGAKLRTHYLCELKDEGTDSWKLISLKTR